MPVTLPAQEDQAAAQPTLQVVRQAAALGVERVPQTLPSWTQALGYSVQQIFGANT
jgi:hypothetical protein